MLVAGFQMPAADLVLHKREFVELRHGNSERLVDPLQTLESGFFGSLGNPEQEIGAVGVFETFPASLRIPNEVRYKMKVADRPEVVDDRTELSVGIDLFEVRLGHSFRVGPVLGTRSCEQLMTVVCDDLFLDNRPVTSSRLSRKRDFVRPSSSVGFIAHRNSKSDVTVIEVPCCQTPDARHASPASHSVLEASTRRRDMPEEPKRIEKVRLARCVGADHEHPIPKIEVGLLEVTPVPYRNVCQTHQAHVSSGHARPV